MAKDDEKTTGRAPAKGGKKKLIIIVAAFAWSALLGGGFAVTKSSRPRRSEADRPPRLRAVGRCWTAITINLADGHYLKPKMTLQRPPPRPAEPRTAPKALDIAIELFSNQSQDKLLTAEGREAAKKELVARVVKAYTEDRRKMYGTSTLTTFVIQ
ncbi:hypothetical protein GCM10020218_017690 [Dactylosporangium vinaceum]